jgi:hypothetical protein
MSTNERDTQFREAAKFLVAKLEKEGFLTPVRGVRPYTLIAQFAYDLVYLALDTSGICLSTGSYDWPEYIYDPDEIIKHVTDLTEWPPS